MCRTACLLLPCILQWSCFLDLGKSTLVPSVDTGEDIPGVDEVDDVDEVEEAAVEDVALEPYGRLIISFSTPFILDEDRINDPTYLEQHQDGILESAAFTGSYGAGRSMPPAGADVTVSFAARAPANASYPDRVAVNQQSSDGADFVNPLANLVLFFDDIEVGEYPVDISSVDRSIQLMLYNVLSDGSSSCVLAMGVGGFLQVTEATGTTAVDGGTLAVTASDLPLYYPTETPLGDMTESIQEGGGEVCARE